MKTFTRWLLVLLLVAVPLMAVIQTASANTELVPASRLVAPYWDVTAGRSTLILLTNVSKSVDLTANAGLPGSSVLSLTRAAFTLSSTIRPVAGRT